MTSTDVINALARSRHSLYMFVSALIAFCSVNSELELRDRSRTNMAEFQERAVVCHCTDEKQFLQSGGLPEIRPGEF